MRLRSCFEGLASGLQTHLVEGSVLDALARIRVSTGFLAEVLHADEKTGRAAER
jgi:hypothetical protein